MNAYYLYCIGLSIQTILMHIPFNCFSCNERLNSSGKVGLQPVVLTHRYCKDWSGSSRTWCLLFFGEWHQLLLFAKKILEHLQELQRRLFNVGVERAFFCNICECGLFHKDCSLTKKCFYVQKEQDKHTLDKPDKFVKIR